MARIKLFAGAVWLLVFLAAAFFSPAAYGAAAAKKVLLLYDKRTPAKAKYDAVSAVANMISHFDTDITELESDKYQPGGIAPYDVVFYLGIGKRNPPKSFYDDVIGDRGKTVCWIYENIFPLIKRVEEGLGFRVTQREYGFNTLNYNNVSFSRSGEDVFVIEVTDRKKAKPWGSLFRKSEFIPYAVSAENFWYICDLPFFMIDSANVFCDLLHDIFKEDHPRHRYAMIRIENVHPMSNPRQLRDMGAVFKKYDIPFLFAVIPSYTHLGGKSRVMLSQSPYVSSALRFLQRNGGSAVLHGYTHQLIDETGEGHEFWDIEKDSPISGDSDGLIKDKLNKGVAECVSNDIYPLAWETPHYGASELDYRVFAKVFSTGVERLQLSDRAFGSEQNFPYFIKSKNGMWVIPENLGYVNYREGYTVERMLEEARKILVVRDAMAVGFIHSYIETVHLERLIAGLKGLGYDFIDLRDIPNQVSTDGFMLFSGLPNYYGRGPFKRTFYDRDVSPVRKISYSEGHPRAFFVDRENGKKDINLSLIPGAGEFILKLPDVEKGIVVAQRGGKSAAGRSPSKKIYYSLFFGDDTSSVSETVIRLILIVFFLMTAAAMTVLLFLYGGYWWEKMRRKTLKE